MKLNRKWLHEEFVDLSHISDKEYVEKLTVFGQKVETYERMDAEIKNVVVGKVVSIAKNREHIQLSADWQLTHRLGTNTHYLIYNGEHTLCTSRLSNIAYRYWTTKELSFHTDIHELPRENACGVATKLHTIDILGYLFVGFYFK